MNDEKKPSDEQAAVSPAAAPSAAAPSPSAPSSSPSATPSSPSPSSPRRARLLTGNVLSASRDKTITVLVERKIKHPLYKKYIRRSTKVHAHDADNRCKVGDTVRLQSCRPLSKLKCWRLVEVVTAADGAATVAGDGNVPMATPTGMSPLNPAYQGNDGAVVADDAATDGNGAAVVVTVATVGDSIGDGVGAVAADTVIDGTVADTDAMKKQNFHTGLDPVSRTKNSAQPTEFNADADTVDKVRYAQLSSLDTGSSPVWSVVADGDADDNDRAVVAGTVGDGKVPSAAPTDMFSTVRGTGYPRPAGMTSHSDDDATDNTRAVVADTVATVNDSVGDGAVGTVGAAGNDKGTVS